MKWAYFQLAYFKQGDDLADCLQQCGNVPEALEQHAGKMDAAAQMLRELKTAIRGQDVTIRADTHMIVLQAEDSLIDRLVALKLVEEEEFDDDEPHSLAEDEFEPMVAPGKISQSP